MDKRFIGIVLTIIVVFAGFVFISGKKSEAPSGSKDTKAKTSNHVIGNPDSKVLLVEYGDFQCPYCQQYEPTIKQVLEQYKDKIRFQFVNYPLISLHQNAFAASRAAEAAHLQGKFWEMHDALYDPANWQVWTQSSSPSSAFNQYAKQLGLDEAKFKTDFASKQVNDVVSADMKEGERLGLTGTPSFFLNGKQVQINNDPAAFQKVLDAELAKQAPKTN